MLPPTSLHFLICSSGAGLLKQFICKWVKLYWSILHNKRKTFTIVKNDTGIWAHIIWATIYQYFSCELLKLQTLVLSLGGTKRLIITNLLIICLRCFTNFIFGDRLCSKLFWLVTRTFESPHSLQCGKLLFKT